VDLVAGAGVVAGVGEVEVAVGVAGDVLPVDVGGAGDGEAVSDVSFAG
jgi:hypothetical protein